MESTLCCLMLAYFLTIGTFLGAGGDLLGHFSTNAPGFRFVGLAFLCLGILFILLFLVSWAASSRYPAQSVFVGVCFYLLILAATVYFTIFLMKVTHGGGGGTSLPGRPYKEYNRTASYSQWLQTKVNDTHNWKHCKAALVKHHVCSKFATHYSNGDDLSYIESGCCKPPDSCNFNYTSAGNNWKKPENHSYPSMDCYKWDNDPNTLCFDCQSCKAGFLQDIDDKWRSVGVALIAMLVTNVAVLFIGFCCLLLN